MTEDVDPRPSIRRAVLADALAGARCHLACWDEAYAGIVEPERLRAVTTDEAGRLASWQRQLAMGHERWIAVTQAGEIVGLAAAGPNRDAELRHLSEVYACYARATYWGSGLGGRLLEAAVGVLPASLWVFEANLRARSFYRKHGFAEDGTGKYDPRFGAEEIRMVRHG